MVCFWRDKNWIAYVVSGGGFCRWIAYILKYFADWLERDIIDRNLRENWIERETWFSFATSNHKCLCYEWMALRASVSYPKFNYISLLILLIFHMSFKPFLINSLNKSTGYFFYVGFIFKSYFLSKQFMLGFLLLMFMLFYVQLYTLICLYT